MSGDEGRIVVAMSGGVDSSVTAALLAERGFEVVGLTLRLWLCEEQTGSSKSCCGTDGVASARSAAAELGVPHYVVEGREPFEEQVLLPSWEEYARGRTPNPCVLCNERIKLGLLLQHADRLGASRLATGHYARVAEGPALLRGRDADKDQSYFLFSLEREQLARMVLPLGELTKEEVRREASRLGLPNAERPESQDACLGGGGEGFAEALRRRFGREGRAGDIVDPTGRVLGRHDGLHRFTVGQRRGLGVAMGRPAYVLAIDPERGDVIVGTDEVDLLSPGLLAGGVRWLVPPPEPGAILEGEVQIRYRHRAVPAAVEVLEDSRTSVRFAEPQRAVTPGQAAVFYREDRVLGGGWIERALGDEVDER